MGVGAALVGCTGDREQAIRTLLNPPVAPSTIAGIREHDTSHAHASRPLEVALIVTQLTAGAGGVALRGAVSLDPRRYRTTIFTSEGSSMIALAEDSGLEVVRLRHMAGGRGVYLGGDTHGFRELTAHLRSRRFDLVHTHSAKAGTLGRLAARRTNVPAIVHTFHGFPFHDFQPAVVRRGLLAAERRLARFTDYFLTAGTMVAADAIRLGLAPPERIRTIDVPVQDDIPAVTEPRRRYARDLMGVPQGATVVGTAARVTGQKAPLDMVRAIELLRRPDVYMVWIGDGDLRAKTERAVARAGLEDRFLLLGERIDVPTLLPGLDVFVLPSLYEGLPCALVEAMTCGIPVVATAVNSVPEIVMPGRTGLLAPPGAPRQLARAIGFMLDFPDAASEMAQAARARIGDAFQPDVHGRELAGVYSLAVRFGELRSCKRATVTAPA
jgi:glycosyltransferase involved in cell wall biosynthesis